MLTSNTGLARKLEDLELPVVRITPKKDRSLHE
jgi:hypothetical protein